MKTPAMDDLLDAASLLRGEQPEDPTAASRVATWLSWYAREIEDRKIARQVGCSLKYLRKMREEDAKAARDAND